MKQKRLEEINLFLMKKGSSDVTEISEKFNISVTTVRRYLDTLQKNGTIKKKYGGVIYIDKQNSLVPYNERVDRNKDKKEYLGKLSNNWIDNNDCIYIDTGTTTKYIIDYIGDKNVTIVTNNLYVIEKCISMKNINLIVLGGELNHDVYAFMGRSAQQIIETYNIRKAFLAATGFTPETGFTNALSEETEMKKCIVSNCKNIFVLIDDTKFGKVAIRTFLECNDKIKIITNEKPTKYTDYFNKNNCNIIY